MKIKIGIASIAIALSAIAAESHSCIYNHQGWVTGAWLPKDRFERIDEIEMESCAEGLLERFQKGILVEIKKDSVGNVTGQKYFYPDYSHLDYYICGRSLVQADQDHVEGMVKLFSQEKEWLSVSNHMQKLYKRNFEWTRMRLHGGEVLCARAMLVIQKIKTEDRPTVQAGVGQ